MLEHSCSPATTAVQVQTNRHTRTITDFLTEEFQRSKRRSASETRVLVQIVEAGPAASGWLSQALREKPPEATVIAVGPGRTDEKNNKVALDVKRVTL